MCNDVYASDVNSKYRWFSVSSAGLSPEWLCVFRQREIVHDRDVNEFLGIVDDRQDGGEITCTSAGRELRRGTLQETGATQEVRIMGANRERTKAWT